jgi:hypothetical protein
MAEEQVQEAVAEQTQASAQETPNYDLTVQDLGALKAIIDVAAQRGAFKPAEMQAIGTVYNKLSGFLDAVGKQGGQKANG